MHRLQKFLRWLPEARWRALYEQAQSQLPAKSQELLLQLRETVRPLSIRGSQKEVLQRLERWIWRYLWCEEYEDFPVHKSPPPAAWVIAGANAYYAAGLRSEAIKVLKYLIESTNERCRFSDRLTLSQWQTEIGQLLPAMKSMRALKRDLLYLKDRLQRLRLLLYLTYLMDKYHGLTASETLQKRIEKLARLKRWNASLPADPSLRAIERNLRGTWALLRLDTTEAKSWYQPDPDLPHAEALPLRLNLWLTLTYEKASAETLLPVLQSFSVPELTLNQRSALLARICETYLLYMPLKKVREALPLLRRAFILQGEIAPSTELQRIRLFWLGQSNFPYAKELADFSANRRYSALIRWQGLLLWATLAIEGRNYESILHAYETMKGFLRYKKKFLPAAVPVLRFLQRFITQKWDRELLRETAQKWQAYFKAASRERFYWHHTFLAMWIEAHLQGQSLREYKEAIPFTSGLEALEAEMRRLLGEWPSS